MEEKADVKVGNEHKQSLHPTFLRDNVKTSHKTIYASPSRMTLAKNRYVA
jgi:hypothetical protein